MKFISQLSLFVISSVSLISACEQPCRIGVSSAFSIVYDPQIKIVFGNLTAAMSAGLVPDSLIAGVAPKINVNDLQSQVGKTISTTVSGIENSLLSKVNRTLLDAIFVQEPKFKGDCGNLVKQPPVGVPWTLDDCAKQTTICGNPPSVCNHIAQVKQRNIAAIMTQMVAGTKSIANQIMTQVQTVLNSAFSKAGADTSSKNTAVSNLTSSMQVNLNAIFNNWNKTSLSAFCAAGACDHADDQIKQLLLSFP